MQTLDHYVQEAAEHRESFQMNEEMKARVSQLLGASRALRKPPKEPWTCHFGRQYVFGPARAGREQGGSLTAK